MKFKHNPNKGTYSIKGMQLEHLQVLVQLLMHTKLGDGLYENAAYELLYEFYELDDPEVLQLDDCVLDISDVDTINLSHFTD